MTTCQDSDTEPQLNLNTHGSGIPHITDSYDKMAAKNGNMHQRGAIMMNPDSQEVCYVSQSSQDENSVVEADSFDNISKMMKPNRPTNQQYEPISRSANLQEAFFKKQMN